MTLSDLIKMKGTTTNHLFKTIGLIVFLQSCTTPSAIRIDNDNLDLPATWQTDKLNTYSATENIKDYESWIKVYNDDQLEQAIQSALNYNRELKGHRVTLEIAKKRLIITDADKLPELSLASNNSRRKNVNDGSEAYVSNTNISATLSYELDVWGKLSYQQQQSQLNYASAKANFNQQKISLVTQVIKQWYDLIEAKKLLELYKDRSDNLAKNLSMIQSSYQLGLGKALDVYLTQNNVTSELARVVQQEQIVKKQARGIEVLLGEYPKGIFEASMDLPKLESDFQVNTPSSILTQRQDLKASWFELLALDAGLAVAHKQRFPRFSLSASTSDSSSELSNLLNGNALAWSLIGNVAMPIFNGGKLAALEEQARLAVVKKEQQYLTQIYNAFADVENALSNQVALLKRFDYLEQAQTNALEAQKLSFNQYMRGLVTYTTVLESERRAFDAQTSLIKLTNELLQNRADTFLALGGVLNDDLLENSMQSANEQEK